METMPEHIARIERDGFQTPADATLVFQFLKVLHEERAAMAKRIGALESLRDETMLASEHGVRLIALIEGFADAVAALNTRANFLEVQLAAAQRLNSIAN
jgi:hypothetical protein